MTGISWFEANAYCVSVGKRLPTGSEHAERSFSRKERRRGLYLSEQDRSFAMTILSPTRPESAVLLTFRAAPPPARSLARGKLLRESGGNVSRGALSQTGTRIDF